MSDERCPFCKPCFGFYPEPLCKNAKIEGVACCYTCWYTVRAVPSAVTWMMNLYNKNQAVEAK